MPQTLSQPAPQIQEPQLSFSDFFPWLCLFLSAIFVLILLRKYVGGLCRDLWPYLPRSLGVSVENFSFSQNWRRKRVYMKIDGDGELGGDNRFVDIGNDEDVSHNSKIKTNHHDPSTSSETEADDSELDSNNTLDLKKYFNPTTSLVHKHILEPPSPVPSFFPHPFQLSSGKYCQHEESTNLCNARPVTPIGHKDANMGAAMDAPIGWLHNLIEKGVRSLERLHTAENNYSSTSL